MHPSPPPSPDRSRAPAPLVVLVATGFLTLGLLASTPEAASAQGEPNRPVLHGQSWVALTGMPRGAESGARMFRQGGNAVDAACAMLAATSTMWDVLSWGGETQALIYDPDAGEVIGINALGVAPTGATPEFFREKEMRYPPSYGPLAAVTPGTPGGLMTMLAEYGTMSLEEVLAPAIELADGYPIPATTASYIERETERLEQWEYSRDVFLGEDAEAPEAGSIFRQPDLARTLRQLVEAERRALEEGASRAEAIYAAYDRFYRGDIAAEIARSTQEQGGLITERDLAEWEVKIEEPVRTDYRGIDVYKLTHWVQGPVMLQMLNMLEQVDLASMGYNSADYIHTIYQVMNHAYADRDFYYGDPYFPPEEPIEGLLSDEYAAARLEGIDREQNDPDVGPGDPYEYQDGSNPFPELREAWPPARDTAGSEQASRSGEPRRVARSGDGRLAAERAREHRAMVERYTRGTTSIQAADSTGWIVSVTPSGGWIPAVIAGETGIGLSQRMQSFVTDSAENPYNVVEPGKRPRATLTPGMALEDGSPFLSFAVQGGDYQDQDLLQFFLDVVEWDMDVQEAAEAAHFHTFQLHNSFGDHEYDPGRLELNAATPPWVRRDLESRGYDIFTGDRTSGPITAIRFDRVHGTMWGAASDHGTDYGIAW